MLKDLEAQLDTELFDYLYHETGNRGDQIMENGLLIKKSPVFDAKNIIQYTTLPLPTYDMDELGEFFESESSIHNSLRLINEVVIIASPKELDYNIAVPYEGYYEGEYYDAVIPSEYILGVIDLTNMEFRTNPNCVYLDEPTRFVGYF